MKITYAKQAVKAIGGMDRKTKQRMKIAIESLPQGDVKPLKGASGSFQLRVGDWRVLFSYPAAGEILIEKIQPRGQVYKGV